MLLTVKERIVLGQALIGVRGNLTELRIIRQLREDLSFSEEEHKELNIQIEGDGIFWNTEGEQPKEIEIGDVARKIIVNRLRGVHKLALVSGLAAMLSGGFWISAVTTVFNLLGHRC